MAASLFESASGNPQAAALFEASAMLQAVLDFEAALVRAEAAEGRMPPAAAQAIAGVCRIGLFDLPSLVAAAAASGKLVGPLLARLRETVALFDAEAAAFVHGESLRRTAVAVAISLQLRRALALIDRDLGRLVQEALQLASVQAAAENKPPRDAVEAAVRRLLAAQRDVRRCGEAALQIDLTAGDGAKSADLPLPEAIAVRVAGQLELPHRSDPAVDSRDGLIRLSCEVALLASGVERFMSALQQAGPESDDIDIAAALVRAAALRAPHRVAALLALAGDRAACESVGAEAAALLTATHGGIAAARRATLASMAEWRARAARPSARQRRSADPVPQSAPDSAEPIAELIAQARQQADQAPWRRWAD